MLSEADRCPCCGLPMLVGPWRAAAFPFLCLPCRMIYAADFREYTKRCPRCGGPMHKRSILYCHECAAAALQVEIDTAMAAAVEAHRRDVERN